VSLVFAYTLVDNCVERPDGLIIGTVFTVILMLVCAVSRSIRSVELRIPHGHFVDAESARLGPETRGKKVHLVPTPRATAEARRQKKAEIVKHYNVRGPVAVLHVNLLDKSNAHNAR